MSAHTKMPLTKLKQACLIIRYGKHTYQIPLAILKKYACNVDNMGESDSVISADTLFAELDQKYTKPGALLRGLRLREGITQIALAKKLRVTQSDVSQMEHGKRAIGRVVAKRIAVLFDIDYRLFLA